MKKLFGFLMGLVLVFAVVGSASALSYTNTVTLDKKLAEGPVAGLGHDSSVTYSHSTPSDFEVPWDVVNRAQLTIAGYWIDGDNDSVAVEGSFVSTLQPGGEHGRNWDWDNWCWSYFDTPSVTSVDISAAFGSWTTGSPMSVTLSAAGGLWDGILEISTSTFTLDYDNATAPVPEPATMVLFGLGLVGVAGVGRKKFKK